jgi:uncharacterized protein (TIGR02118 family)
MQADTGPCLQSASCKPPIEAKASCARIHDAEDWAKKLYLAIKACGHYQVAQDKKFKIIMLKFVYCVRRNPKMSAEAFRKYWLENHGPLVRSNAQALKAKRYVQSHTLDHPLNAAAQQPRGTKPAYDGLTELWWDSADDLIAALSTPEGQKANLVLAEDEARFCDLPNCSVFFTEEHTIFDL